MTTRIESDNATFHALASQIDHWMTEFHVPGATVGVFHEGDEWTAGFGVTSVEHPLPVDADTLFQIGSTTKTITGTVAMRLVEEGRLDLDAPIRTYLPDLQLQSEEVATRVTMRHLFTHTGGWVGDYFDDFGWGDDALAKMVARMAMLEQLMPLGAIWSYNNSGFYLAGRVIEVLTGKAYETVVKEMLLDPLGMDHSFFFAHDVITHRFAVGHLVQDDRPQVARPWALPRAAHPAGGLSASIRDQLKYARFHLGDGTAPDGRRLLSRESLERMQTPLVPAGNFADWVGITWFIREIDGTRLVQHGGSTHGQQSAFLMVPSRQFAIAVVTNASTGGQLHEQATRWALEHFLGLQEPELQPLPVSESQLAEYTGRYSTPLVDIDLALEDGNLVVHTTLKGGFPTPDSPPPPAPPPTRLVLMSQDRVVALDPPFKDSKGEFLRHQDGRIAWFRWGGRAARRQET
jgi:CubicO group peptidase (beta-lactamase class C family)